MNSNDENALTSSQILHDLIFMGGTSTRQLQQQQEQKQEQERVENSKRFQPDPESESELKLKSESYNHEASIIPKKRKRGRPSKRDKTVYAPAQESKKFKTKSKILACVERQRGRKGEPLPFHGQSILLSQSVYIHPNRFQGLTDFASHNTVRLFVILKVVLFSFLDLESVCVFLFVQQCVFNCLFVCLWNKNFK